MWSRRWRGREWNWKACTSQTSKPGVRLLVTVGLPVLCTSPCISKRPSKALSSCIHLHSFSMSAAKKLVNLSAEDFFFCFNFRTYKMDRKVFYYFDNIMFVRGEALCFSGAVWHLFVLWLVWVFFFHFEIQAFFCYLASQYGFLFHLFLGLVHLLNSVMWYLSPGL